MTIKTSKFASSVAMAAALSLGATPAGAAEPPEIGFGRDMAQAGYIVEEQNHHRWRRHHRHRNRIDAGDVVAGVLVIGTIAAIAGAFDGDDDRRDRRQDDHNYRDYDVRDYDDRRDRYDSNGVQRAADICVDQIERGPERVNDVTQAVRRSDGWFVAGTLENGSDWNCWIDNQGRLRSLDFGPAEYSGGYEASTPSTGEQWSDGAYARARATTRTPAQSEYAYRSTEASRVEAPETEGPQPDYPGGPLPGEEGYGEPVDYSGIDADID